MDYAVNSLTNSRSQSDRSCKNSARLFASFQVPDPTIILL